MNCKDVRKYLYAFADGELDTPSNLDVLEHLNVCPVCAGRVNAEQQLKGAIARVAAGPAAPPSLLDSLRAALVGEDHDPASSERFPESPDGAQVIPMPMRGSSRPAWYRFGLPAAVAAGIVLAMLALWPPDTAPTTEQYADGANTTNQEPPGLAERAPGPADGTANPPVTPGTVLAAHVTDASPTAVKLADRVFEEHRVCCEAGEAHHDESLPRDPLAAAEAMAARLGRLPILRCAGLAGAADGRFETAGFCKLVDTQGVAHSGSHMVYRFEGERHVSLISVEPLPEMKTLQTTQIGRRNYAILAPRASRPDAPITVVIFNCPKATHIVCAPLDPPKTVEIVTPMQLAWDSREDHPAAQTIALASGR